MQFFNMLQFAMLILLQQEATFAQRFGCKGHVKDHPISVCVAKLRIDPMDGPIVNVKNRATFGDFELFARLIFQDGIFTCVFTLKAY
ncbi:hypothetical protein KEM48_005572 [Puccinia striiformis f. sp. tritici PST-130]|nr:hypothetical protein KEM48_005572 [Puccinia striiformis f. sp. tritici PST-130]